LRELATDEIRTAIDKANKRFSEGFVKGDASITASGFADDAVIFPRMQTCGIYGTALPDAFRGEKT
jgi:ketosteroid isomerase-like protein